MGETRVDLLHLLEDLRDAYPGSTEETILTEIVAAATIDIATDPTGPTLTIVDDGTGMQRRELARYHDIAMALAPLAVEPAKEHAFITEFLASWGEALDRRKARTGRRT